MLRPRRTARSAATTMNRMVRKTGIAMEGFTAGEIDVTVISGDWVLGSDRVWVRCSYYSISFCLLAVGTSPFVLFSLVFWHLCTTFACTHKGNICRPSTFVHSPIRPSTCQPACIFVFCRQDFGYEM